MSPSGRVNYFWRWSFFSYTDIWQQSELCTAAAHREEVKSSTEAVKTGHQSTEKHLKWTVCLFVLHLQSECGHLCWYKILEKHLNLLSFLFLDLTKVKYHVYYWNHKRGNIKNHLTDWCAAFVVVVWNHLVQMLVKDVSVLSCMELCDVDRWILVVLLVLLLLGNDNEKCKVEMWFESRQECRCARTQNVQSELHFHETLD